MTDAQPLDWGNALVVEGRKKKKRSSDDDGSRELRDLQRGVKALAKGGDKVAKAVDMGITAWNDAWQEAEDEGDDGPVRHAVDIWAAGASATLAGLSEAPTAMAKAWDKPIKVKRIRKMMPMLPSLT
jgi:hypothetical protein